LNFPHGVAILAAFPSQLTTPQEVLS
jgi:hypothetical protein